MIVKLFFRHYGIHDLKKECEIEKPFNFYAKKLTNDDYEIDEQKLINDLPEKFLPRPPEKILLTVENDVCSIGQRETLKIFRPWAKYFDSYSICLVEEKPA